MPRYPGLAARPAILLVALSASFAAPAQSPPAGILPLQLPPVSLERSFRLEVQIGAPLELGTVDGVRRGPPEVLQRLLKGGRVDPALYYFRSSPSFEVADGPYEWLRESVFVCAGARESARVVLDCYAVL